MKGNSYRRSTGSSQRHRSSQIYGRSNGSIYVDGDTARVIEPMYVDRPLKKQSVSPTVRRNRERAQYMSLGYICFLTLMIGILCTGCIWYVNLRSELTASQKRVSQMQISLTRLQQSNDEEYDRIISSVDLEAIKKTAMNELGMKYPDNGQVVDIDGTGTDFVRQYKGIPEK